VSERDGANGWEIYRLEFAFLNPEEYRWQLFQYWPATDGAVPNKDQIDEVPETYRRQAQKLLSWVSTSLENLEWKTKSGETKRHKFQRQIEQISLDGSKIKREITSLLESNGDSEAGLTFSNLMDAYSDEIKRHFNIDHLDFPKENIFNEIKNGNCNIPITGKFAIDLISSLYIAYDWDIFGRLAYRQDGKEIINASTLGSFSYALSYPQNGDVKLLGYPVEIVHLSNSKLRKVMHMKDDYFEYCNNIQDRHKNWYRIYGHLIDELNKDVAASGEHIYVRCFPLRICGYDHFLQILLRPELNNNDGHFRGDIPELFSSKPREGVPSLVVFKECLRELIVQMHVATFQRRVLDEFSSLEVCKKGDEALQMEIFARHAPNLVKMEGLWVKDCYYTYVASGDLGFKQWRATSKDEVAWVSPPACGGNGQHFARLVSGKIIANVPWEEDYKDLASLLDGTGEMRLEEQWQWLKTAAGGQPGSVVSVSGG
jgi:hypothetical protein